MTPLQTLTAMRAAYGTPMTRAQRGELLNRVAWTHRAEGWGLLKKPSGANAPQPQTGIEISSDILTKIEAGELVLYDCFIDSEGKATPAWGRKKNLQDVSRWTAPVDANGTLPPHPPEPPQPPTMPAGRPYPGDAFGVQVGRYLFADYEMAGQAPNEGMGVWFLRVSHDITTPPYLTPAQSLEKHRREWRDLLGLPG